MISNLNSIRSARLLYTIALFILALAGAFWQPAAAADLSELEEEAMLAAAKRVAPAVLRVQTVGARGGAAAPGPTTGFVVSEDGYIISSAFRFAQKPEAILVTLPDGSTKPARLIATDHSRSLVLLKIDLKAGAAKLPVFPALSPNEFQVGQWAIAMGRTFEVDEPNVSVGIISGLNRIWGKAIQTDAKISPANYGGPLVDIHGRVFGVLAPLSLQSTAAAAGAELYDSGIGFAVPLADINRVLPKLKRGTDLFAGLMGVSLAGRSLIAGAPKLAAIHPGSPADEAGLEKGDSIIEVNGTPVANQAQLKHQISPLYAGDKVKLAVLRNKKRLEAELILTNKLKPYRHPFLGILPLRDPSEKAGVVVRYVYPGSPANEAGIVAGDRIVKFDGKETGDSAKLLEMLNGLSVGQKTNIELRRDGNTSKLELTLAALPEAIPPELPSARAKLKPLEAAEVKVGVFDVKFPEFKNQCLAYVPKKYSQNVPHGVVIWLHEPGKFDRDKLLARWKDHLDAHDLILLAPQARDDAKWSRDEVVFIRRALASIQKDYSVDPARIVSAGRGGGGAMAYIVGFSQRDAVRAIAVVDATAPAFLKPPPIDPAMRLAVYTAAPKSTRTGRRVAAQARKLREVNYPVTSVELGDASRSLNDEELASLMRWIDTLDRI